MLKIILVIVVLIIVAVLVLASRKPDVFRVERSTTVNCPPARLFALINDFHKWTAWSPYEKMDPTMKRTYGGSESGVGAMYSWEGNSKVGQGEMEIVESSPNRIRIKLDFYKPFEAHNMAQFDLVSQGNATKIVWSMEGPTPFMGKIMHVFFDMDTMVGKDFETGLANLKAENEPAASAP